ncbi:MAG: hypothetical protein MR850_06630 [Bacteroidales bacterium]|nr:hypothetical protein [Bacteroidales bacterium]
MRRLCEACGKPKLVFLTEQEAKKFIKSKHNRATNVHLAPYFCDTCQAWHLTHKTH